MSQKPLTWTTTETVERTTHCALAVKEGDPDGPTFFFRDATPDDLARLGYVRVAPSPDGMLEDPAIVELQSQLTAAERRIAELTGLSTPPESKQRVDGFLGAGVTVVDYDNVTRMLGLEQMAREKATRERDDARRDFAQTCEARDRFRAKLDAALEKLAAVEAKRDEYLVALQNAAPGDEPFMGIVEGWPMYGVVSCHGPLQWRKAGGTVEVWWPTYDEDSQTFEPCCVLGRLITGDEECDLAEADELGAENAHLKAELAAAEKERNELQGLTWRETVKMQRETVKMQRDRLERDLTLLRERYAGLVAAVEAYRQKRDETTIGAMWLALQNVAIALDSAPAPTDAAQPADAVRWTCQDCGSPLEALYGNVVLPCGMCGREPAPAAPATTGAAQPADERGASSLWTTPARVGRPPLPEAAVDPTVTREQVVAAIEAQSERAAAFRGGFDPDPFGAQKANPPKIPDGSPVTTDAAREAAAEILAAFPRCYTCPAPARFEDGMGVPRCNDHALPLGMFPVQWLPALEVAERIAKGRADG